jgi:hypothetical protein
MTTDMTTNMTTNTTPDVAHALTLFDLIAREGVAK